MKLAGILDPRHYPSELWALGPVLLLHELLSICDREHVEPIGELTIDVLEPATLDGEVLYSDRYGPIGPVVRWTLDPW